MRISGYKLNKIIDQIVWPEMRKIKDAPQIAVKEKLELYAKFARMLQMQKRYDQVVKLCTDTLNECILADEDRYDIEMIITMYICLAVCLCGKKDYERAVRVLENAGSLDLSDLSEYVYFTLWYDYYIVKLKLKGQSTEDNEKVLVSDIMNKFAGKKNRKYLGEKVVGTNSTVIMM